MNLKRHFVSAIIPAAGQGTRMNAAMNKQYLTLGGRPILSYAIDTFEHCDLVDEIVVVIGGGEQGIFNREVRRRRPYRKIKIAFGGATRQDSVANGLKALDPRCDLVMIHDGARPLIGEELLIRCIYETITHHATVVAVPAKNTIKVVKKTAEDGKETLTVDHTPERATLYEIQTPQSFDRALIEKAFKKAEADGFVGTDDASLVEHLGEPVTIVRGHYNNIKITTPEDLLIADAVMSPR